MKWWKWYFPDMKWWKRYFPDMKWWRWYFPDMKWWKWYFPDMQFWRWYFRDMKWWRWYFPDMKGWKRYFSDMQWWRWYFPGKSRKNKSQGIKLVILSKIYICLYWFKLFYYFKLSISWVEMVFVVGNGLSYLSCNPERSRLYFPLRQFHFEGMNLTILPPVMCK